MTYPNELGDDLRLSGRNLRKEFDDILKEHAEIRQSRPKIDTDHLKSLLEDQGVKVDGNMSAIIDYMNPSATYSMPKPLADMILEEFGEISTRIVGAQLIGQALDIDNDVVNIKLCILEHYRCIVESQVDITNPEGVIPRAMYELTFTDEIREACRLN